MSSLLDVRSIDPAVDRLLNSIYEGPFEETPWQSFLPLFCAATGAFAVSLVLRPPAPDDPGLILNYQRPDHDDSQTRQLAAPTDWPALAYKEEFFAIDPFINLPPDQVVSMDEVLSEEQLLRSEFYRNYLKPAGVFHILGTDTVEDDGLRARLRACRARHEPPFTDVERALFRMLVPHVRRAIRIHVRFNRTESERDLYAGAVNRFSVGTLLLDEQNQVLSCNPIAEQLLAEEDGLRLQDQKLLIENRGLRQELQAMIERIKLAQQEGLPGMAEAMRIPRNSGKADLGLVIRPVPASSWSEGQSCPAVAVFISDPEHNSETSGEIITRLFGFTPAESTVALKLSKGLSLAEIAEQQGISQHTARAQLKSIFAKAGVTRQAELVRLIVKSVANLG